jgi:low affinity Fe/Cu permease
MLVRMHNFFRIYAIRVSQAIGSLWALAFVLAVISSTGFYYEFSDSWKNNVMLATSIVTLLVLVFLQKSQNHNDKAINLKLDELVKSSKRARNEVVFAEHKTESEIDKLKDTVIDEDLGNPR